MKIYCISHTGKGRGFRFREDDPRLEDTDATSLAAAIVARREFGRNGIVRTMREDSHTADYTSFTSEAFIGKYDRKGGTCTGHNIWLFETITKE